MENTIAKKSLADEVADRIRLQITSGEYKVNQQLPIEPELMQNFGVGRSTIREAIKLLVNSGMLRVQQGIGTFVEDNSGIGEPLSQRLKRSDAKDIDEVRQLLEMKIAEKAAQHRNEKDIRKMKKLLEAREQAVLDNSVEDCIDADINFHVAVAEASRNDILSDLYKSFSTRLKSNFLQTYADVSAFAETTDLHRGLLDSIIKKQAMDAWTYAARINGHITG